jgi:hypothetical protein
MTRSVPPMSVGGTFFGSDLMVHTAAPIFVGMLARDQLVADELRLMPQTRRTPLMALKRDFADTNISLEPKFLPALGNSGFLGQKSVF